MIEALISGELQGQPEQRTAKTGRAFVQARMRVAAGAEEVHFVRVTAFSDSACTALLALGDGDALAVAGTLKPGAWVDREGNAKLNLDMVAAQVLTAYHLKRRRDAVQPGEGGPAAAPTPPSMPSPPPARGTGVQRRRSEPDHENFATAGEDAWLAGDAP